MSRRYTLQSNSIYGWFTGGTADGLRVLMGIDWNAMICMRFDAAGNYVGCEERYFGHDGEPTNAPVTKSPFHLASVAGERVEERFDDWKRDMLNWEGPIETEEFHHPTRFIGVEPFPDWYQQMLENPSAYSPQQRAQLESSIDRWRKDGDFVFWWNENYLCNADGTVHSS